MRAFSGQGCLICKKVSYGVDTHQLLYRLSALSKGRKSQGDSALVLCPNSTAQEVFPSQDDVDWTPAQGLVLEPFEHAPFTLRPLASRQKQAKIMAFCDGIRSTYILGYEGSYPLFYTRNASVVRTREVMTGYHTELAGIHRWSHLLLAPFHCFPEAIRGAYERLSLYAPPLSDLCWTSGASNEPAGFSTERGNIGSLMWQWWARRRARHLLDLSEQMTSMTGARLVRESDPTGSSWLLKDGSLFQFKQEWLSRAEPLRNIVSCVKTHPVPFFGSEGERQLIQLEVGQRSVAFLPRPRCETPQQRARRPLVSWYLRVRAPSASSPNALSGIVRLDIAAVADWRRWVDEVSWAVLDEFYGISALPDKRYDVMPYGIYDCEQFLKAQELPADYLFAPLHDA